MRGASSSGLPSVVVPRRGREGDDGYGRDVLEEQDAEGRAAMRGGAFIAVVQELQAEGRRAEGEAEGHHHRFREGQAGNAEADGHDEGGGREDLHAADAADRDAHVPEAPWLELEADDEQHEDDPELANGEGRLRIIDEAEDGRADRDPGGEIAEHGPEAEALEYRDRDDGDAEEDEGLSQHGVIGSRNAARVNGERARGRGWDMLEAVRQEGDGAVILVFAVPRASRTELAGLHDGRLRLRVASPPVDGAANDAIVRFFAKALGVGKGSVEIRSGATGRQKTVAVSGLTPDEVVSRLGL